MWSGAPWQVGRFRITVLVWRPVLAPNHLLLHFTGRCPGFRLPALFSLAMKRSGISRLKHDTRAGRGSGCKHE